MRFALVLSLFFGLLPVAGASTSRIAHITVTSRSPVIVRGTGFRSTERVVVTVSMTKTYKKTVTATRLGAIRATFTGVSISNCQIYSVRAKGNRGSTAILKVIPECPSLGPSG